MKTIFLSALALLTSLSASAQLFRGTVSEVDNTSKKAQIKPIPFANVYWLSSLSGTTTDDNGKFELKKGPQDGHKLVVSFVGYTNDTIEIKPNDNDINIVLSSNLELDEVQIVQRIGGAYISRLSPAKTEVITSVGLCQLACCNLAESFENSATVDVGYADAVSGAKQIQMLGLTGLYSQLMYENMPFLRGLSAPYGLSYVPGSFMESIQISKGTASVLNGFEALSGQINIEYRKPQTADPLFVNLYANHEGRLEANVIGNIRINERLGTTTFANMTYFDKAMDHVGHDGFMDMPKNKQVNLVNRWSYDGDNYRNVTSISAIFDDREGGQVGFNPSRDQNETNIWGFTNKNTRLQAFTKNGVVFEDGSNMGTQISATYLDMKARYGFKIYDATETNLYANIIYEKPINDRHKFNAGISYQYNAIKEIFEDPRQFALNFGKTSRTEHVPGVFAQYSLTLAMFSLVAGFRYDYNSAYKQSLITPRLHMKLNIGEEGSLRGSIGKGYRSPNIYAENIGLMASSRFVRIGNDIRMEDAWNYGINYVHGFQLNDEHHLTLSFDAYRTSFVNQLVVDLEEAHEVHFYMSDQKSYSNSLQAEAKFDFWDEHWTLTLAGRYNDVKYTKNDELIEKPYVSKWKGLIVNNFRTNMNKWMFDLTFQFNGQMRLPNTGGLRDAYSKPYPMVHTQLTKRFKYVDIYAGCENVFNELQPDPIIGADDPFGPNFDASVIWGSLMSRTFYIGLRLTI